MTLSLDLTKFEAAAKKKVRSHDNCTVLDLDPESVGSTVYPRMIEVRPPGDDGPRQFARWDGGLNLAVNDKVLCKEFDNAVWVVEAMGGDSSGAGLVRVSDVWDSGFAAVAWAADASGNLTGSASISAANFAFIVKNTSGAAAAANALGYIDEAGEYKTTTTAQAEVAWCVVIVGGANNADIYVSRRGRGTMAYAGSAPTAGQFITTSTTAGSGQAQATMRPEICAVCLANGAGGTVSVLLLTERKYVPFASSNNTWLVSAADDSDFVTTVAVAGVSGDKVYYNAPSSGDVNTITPGATGELAKTILHNTTRTETAFIIATGADGGGNFIQVSSSADISAWVSTDAITTRSQTNTSTIGTSHFYDLEITSSEVPALATMIDVTAAFRDTGAAGERLFAHPFEASDTAKRKNTPSFLTGDVTNVRFLIPLIQSRLQLLWEASGAGTAGPSLRIQGVIIATP